MKILKTLFAFVLVLCLLAGCGGNTDPAVSFNPGSTAPTPAPTPAPTTEPTSEPTAEPTQEPALGYARPQIEENYFELVCEDMDFTYHPGFGSDSVTFYLIADQWLENGDVQISTNLGKTYEPFVEGEMQADTLSMPLFLSYQGFDWKSHAQLELENPEEADKQENLRYVPYTELRKALKKKPLYSCQLSFRLSKLLPADYVGEYDSVKLPSGVDTLEIQEITVTVKGQSKTYHPKRFCITSKLPKFDGESFKMTGMSASNEIIKPSSDGKFTDIPLIYQAREDVTLTGFAFPDHPDNQVVSCRLKITNPNGSDQIKMDWDGKTPVEVAAGSRIDMELTFIMPQWAGSLSGCGSMDFSTTYELGGVKCYERFYLTYALFSTAYEYYAQKYDGVDVMSYYRDYLSVVEAAD